MKNTMKVLTKRLDAWLSENNADYYEVLQEGASADDLTGLPPAVAELYRWRNGQSDGGASSFLGSYFFMSIDEMKAQKSSIAQTRQELGHSQEWWSDDWFPIFDDGGGNLICVDGKTSKVLFYENDNPNRGDIAPSLEALFTAIVESLEKNAWTGTDGYYDVTDQPAWDEICLREKVLLNPWDFTA
jgi:cell wall assembly regulator SMI1